MTTNTAVPKTFLLLTQSLCVSAVLICSHSYYLGSSGQLTCTGRSTVHVYTNPSEVVVAECTLSSGSCDTLNVSASGINGTHTVLNISRLEPKDAGEWSCTAGILGVSKCVLTLVKTPSCNITSKEDTDVVMMYQQLNLTVDVRDYYCSTAYNISLQTGDVTTPLVEADSVPSVADNTSSVTLNVTDSHLGKVGLVFRCRDNQWPIACAGVTELAPKIPTCAITSDKVAETLILNEEVTLTVDITAYYDIRGSYCSADSNFTLQTGDVSQVLHVSDQGLSPITFSVTETHLGAVRLVFNCQVQDWNLICDGVTRLNNKMKRRDDAATASTPIIIAGVSVSLVLIVVVAIIIVVLVKRKVNRIKPRSSVKPCSPPYITVGEPISAAYATVEANNSIPPASGTGESQKVVAIDAGGYACVGDLANAENTSPRDKSDELSTTSADRPKKGLSVIVQRIFPQDDQTCVNELYSSVQKPNKTASENDTTAV